MQLLVTYCEKFVDIQADIDVLSPSNNLRESIEDICIIKKLRIGPQLKKSCVQNFNKGDSSSHYQMSQLPKMSLPRFCEKHTELKNFISPLRVSFTMTCLLQTLKN